MAASANDVAAIAIMGRATRAPNFPDLAGELPRAASTALKGVQAATTALAASRLRPPRHATTTPPLLRKSASRRNLNRRRRGRAGPIENETLQLVGDIGLDYTYFDVPDALPEFGVTLPPPPRPSYCGSPWDDAADDLFFREPLPASALGTLSRSAERQRSECICTHKIPFCQYLG
ncbi:hypothetical protein ABZP36_007043 [Zizania latifolia]